MQLQPNASKQAGLAVVAVATSARRQLTAAEFISGTAGLTVLPLLKPNQMQPVAECVTSVSGLSGSLGAVIRLLLRNIA